MIQNKTSELSLFSLFALIFGSALFVSAAALNFTNNSNDDIILNNTLPNTSTGNLSLISNSTVANVSLTNETANVTIPIENIPLLNQSVIANETVNLTTPIGNIFSINESGNLSLNITITNQSVNLSEELFNLSNITTLNYSAVVIENLSTNLSNNATRLAKVFDEDLLDFDRQFRDNYLIHKNNFSDLPFKNVTLKENTKFLVGSRNDNIKGFEINNNKFAIDLLGCNSYSKYCTFRINGVTTKHMYSVKDFPNRKTTFDLDGQYVMKIENIDFDYCDNRRFCHLGYEGYNVVDVSVERK